MGKNKKGEGAPQIGPHDPEHVGSGRDPEERDALHPTDEREKSLDKTLADSFPTSDPPSSIPDPRGDTSRPSELPVNDALLVGLKQGTWAAFSIDDRKVVGIGETQEDAEADAKKRHFSQVQLIQVPAPMEVKKAS